MMRVFRRRRDRNTLGDMASATIAGDDTPSGEPPVDTQHGSVKAQDFLKQWLVTLAGCVIGNVDVFAHVAYN